MQFITSLKQLCKTVLKLLSALAGQPIIISSSYHSNQLNVKVGGADTSQHTLGETADINILKSTYTDWYDNKMHTDKGLAERWFS